MKTHPRCEFFIFDSRIFYNSIPEQSGAFSYDILNCSGGTGFISLYEYNIDKSSTEGVNPFIYPFITKGSANLSWRTANSTADKNEWTKLEPGTVLKSTYPMSASISREFLLTAGDRPPLYDISRGAAMKDPAFSPPKQMYGAPTYPHYWALRNRLNFYGLRSRAYVVSASLDDDAGAKGWDKDSQTINLISIPSIFYGSGIKPGTVSLKWYFTGSLMAELRDTRENGELIQVSSSEAVASAYDNEIAGVVLYEEGFILLTGSWSLNSVSTIALRKGDSTARAPTWYDFGAGAQDGVTQANTAASFVSASFGISFLGKSQTQTVTMFANARRGEVNFSNNPTFPAYGSKKLHFTSSQVYEENSDRVIANIRSSSFSSHSASFKRHVFINKVGLYDEHKNLIGIANMASPVRKEEDQDFSFKLKIDI
tara:strand:- start:415 stop:1692 length:1278 start_codon:yes stop_codon:yes gene_type:complete